MVANVKRGDDGHLVSERDIFNASTSHCSVSNSSTARYSAEVTPQELGAYLDRLVASEVRHAAMIWGPPGIGKSSIVAQAAKRASLDFVDVRLSQLAPTDLRGLPVPTDGVSRWFPPEFLPREGNGILFLDELNMAPPTMQGVAQQLILDRRVGSYVLPDGWFVWAAGNRKEDRASVFDMPAPLANRFIHLDVAADLESFRTYAIDHQLDPRINAFLAFRPELVHQLDTQQPAWPSPRSWDMASTLLGAGLDVTPAVGPSAALEFQAFGEVYDSLPSIHAILDGNGTDLSWPDEPSARYAITLGLALQADTSSAGLNGFRWLSEKSSPEWVQLYATDLVRSFRARGQIGALAVAAKSDDAFRVFVMEHAALTGQVSKKDPSAHTKTVSSQGSGDGVNA